MKKTNVVILILFTLIIWFNIKFGFTQTFPIADFTVNQTVICLNDSIQFTNSSQNFTTSSWTIISTNTINSKIVSNQTNPKIIFNRSGYYTVQLVVSNTNTPTVYDTLIRTNYINVLPKTDIFFGNLQIYSLCDASAIEYDTLKPLNQYPSGGVYSSSNPAYIDSISGFIYLRNLPNSAETKFYYTYVNNQGCESKDSAIININDTNYNISFFVDTFNICLGDTLILNNANKIGGTYYSTGGGIRANSNIFDSYITSSGTFEILYSYLKFGCKDTSSFIVNVNNRPTPHINTDDSICFFDLPYDLTNIGSPIGGNFTGKYITENIFNNPDIHGLNKFNVSYTVTNINCTETVSDSIVVIGGNEFYNFDYVKCLNDTAFHFIYFPSNSQFNGKSIVDNIFYPIKAGVDTHLITQTSSGQCPDTSTYNIIVEENPNVTKLFGLVSVQSNVKYYYYVSEYPNLKFDWTVSGGIIVDTNNNQVSIIWNDTTKIGVITIKTTTLENCIGENSWNITVNDIRLGINNLQTKFGIELYPNPFTNQLNFKINNNKDKISVNIMDALGHKLWDKNIKFSNSQFQIPTENWKKGIYFINIISNNQSKMLKYFKQ